jgi:hypothetical protein
MSAGSPEHVVVEEDQVRPNMQLPPPSYVARWLAFDMHSSFVHCLEMHSLKPVLNVGGYGEYMLLFHRGALFQLRMSRAIPGDLPHNVSGI